MKLSRSTLHAEKSPEYLPKYEFVLKTLSGNWSPHDISMERKHGREIAGNRRSAGSPCAHVPLRGVCRMAESLAHPVTPARLVTCVDRRKDVDAMSPAPAPVPRGRVRPGSVPCAGRSPWAFWGGHVEEARAPRPLTGTPRSKVPSLPAAGLSVASATSGPPPASRSHGQWGWLSEVSRWL